ncbi:MAG: hypothetical protein WC419_07175 [Candidatus Omnitrophota bacterium]|jgi:flagellar basal body-associated protein FliL
MIAKYSKKGFISIFWIAIMMVVTTAIMVTATYMFSTFAATPVDLLLTPLQEYYNAELGISYGDYKIPIDPNVTGLTPASPSYTYPDIVVNGTNVTVTITYVSAGSHYTIKSTANNRTITANWDEGIITQMN